MTALPGPKIVLNPGDAARAIELGWVQPDQVVVSHPIPNPYVNPSRPEENAMPETNARPADAERTAQAEARVRWMAEFWQRLIAEQGEFMGMRQCDVLPNDARDLLDFLAEYDRRGRRIEELASALLEFQAGWQSVFGSND